VDVVSLIGFTVIYLYLVWMYELRRWNDGICEETKNLWIMTHMDMFGMRHYISFNNGEKVTERFLFPVDKDYYSR